MDFSFKYAQYSHFNLLSKKDQKLVDAAFEAMNKAYAPYSEFQVGASVLLGNRHVVLGNNQENWPIHRDCVRNAWLCSMQEQIIRMKLSIQFVL